MRDQFKIASLVLDFFLTRCNKAPAMLKDDFKKQHGAAFEHLNTVFDENDKSDFMEGFFVEQISASSQAFVKEVLGLE